MSLLQVPCAAKSLGLSRQGTGMIMPLPYLQSVLRKSPVYLGD